MSEQWLPVAGTKPHFVKPNTLAVGQEIIGVYLGQAIGEMFGNVEHRLDVQGVTTVINGTGQLNHALGKVQPGSVVKLIYKGMKTLEKGKFKNKPAHQFEVFVRPSSAANDPVPMGYKPPVVPLITEGFVIPTDISTDLPFEIEAKALSEKETKEAKLAAARAKFSK
jgi:hypothetical protein